MFYKPFFPILSDKFVGKMYQKHGSDFGGAVSMLYMGQCVGFKNMLSRWMAWEVEYLKRGFRSLPVDEFTRAGGYGYDIDDQIMVRRKTDEKAIFHGKIFKEEYLGKMEKLINLDKVMNGEMQQGHWCPPTTADAVVHTS